MTAARRLARLLGWSACLLTVALAVLGPGAGVARAAKAKPASATLVLRTVPAVAGARVSLDGSTFLTDASGSVVIATFAGPHLVGVQAPQAMPAGTSLRFAGWAGGATAMPHSVTLPGGTTLEQVGFRIARPISLRVVDGAGRPVPLADISSITVASNLGRQFTFAPGAPPALFANRIVQRGAGLQSVPVRYAVRSVVIGGANVVYQGTQQFVVRPSATWTVKALLFALRIEVRDALFGFGIGHAVRLTLPDGSTRTIALGPGSSATASGLPRGLYRLQAKGPGLGLSAQTALSRPQVAKVLLFSWLDVAVVAVGGLLFVVGLPLLGGRIVRRPGRSPLPSWRQSRGGAPATGAPATVAPAAGTPATGAPATVAPATVAPAAGTPATVAPAAGTPLAVAPASEPAVGPSVVALRAHLSQSGDLAAPTDTAERGSALQTYDEAGQAMTTGGAVVMSDAAGTLLHKDAPAVRVPYPGGPPVTVPGTDDAAVTAPAADALVARAGPDDGLVVMTSEDDDSLARANDEAATAAPLPPETSRFVERAELHERRRADRHGEAAGGGLAK